MPDITTIVYLAAKAYAVYKTITSKQDCEPGYDCSGGSVVDICQGKDNSVYSCGTSKQGRPISEGIEDNYKGPSDSTCEPGYDCSGGDVVDIYQEHDKSAYLYANIISTPYGPVYSYSRKAAAFWPLGHSPLKICPPTDKCTIEDIYEGQEGSVNSCRENQVIIEIFKVDDDTFMADDTAQTPRIYVSPW